MTVTPATPDAIAEAARLLRDGELVAFPTETVYGLGADATNGLAVAKIFEAKGRPRFNPLIVHVASLDAAKAYGDFGAQAQRLAEAFWPGPLTLVVNKRGDALSGLVSAGLNTVALRVPSHPISRSLLEESGLPLAAPSANRSGHVSATTADHVAADLGDRVAMILDGGPTSLGVESTIVDATGSHLSLLRPGSILAETIENAVAASLEAARGVEGRPSSPGRMASHYATRAALRLNALDVGADEALLAFGRAPMATQPSFNLSESGDLREAAANLFSALRGLDATGVAAIAVMPIPEKGLGVAINDRLRRAAAPRRP